jgi:hypothetical protein
MQTTFMRKYFLRIDRVLSIYELSWEIYKTEGGGLIAMISTDNGDNLF